jgi:hypothetical protein
VQKEKSFQKGFSDCCAAKVLWNLEARVSTAQSTTDYTQKRLPRTRQGIPLRIQPTSMGKTIDRHWELDENSNCTSQTPRSSSAIGRMSIIAPGGARNFLFFVRTGHEIWQVANELLDLFQVQSP